MQHLDEGTIHAWLDGALDAEEAVRVEEHVAACAACAAAVAEARGLAAGASRILASLDNVPGGVIPGTKAPAESTPIASRRSRSLWNTLHLTPGRAAAAALLFVAAGTALVLRQKPNDSVASPYALAGRDSRQHVTTEVPMSASQSSAAVKAALPPARPAPAPLAAKRAQPRDVAVVAGQPEAGAVDSVAAAPSPRLTTGAERKAAAAPAPSPLTADVAKSVASAVGGAPRMAAPVVPEAARAKMTMSQMKATSAVSATSPVGCYTVEGDSVPMLPRRIMLETSNAGLAPSALREAATSRNFAVVERRAIGAIVGDTVTPVSSWQWSSRPGGIRLEMVTPSAAAAQLDSISTSGDLRGAVSVNGRQITVLLRHVDCPGR